MDIIEACKEMEKGKKITHKSWKKNTYIYKNDIYLNFCDCTGMSKVRKGYYINDINLILSSDWEIYKSEEEILIKKGKMLEIARYCNKHRCDKSCLLYEKRECGRENYWRYDKVVLNKSCRWEDDMVENSYKIIKED